MSLPQLLVDASSPEIRARTGLTAPDVFLYLRDAAGKDSAYFDAREYGVQQERLKALGSSLKLVKLEPYLEQAEKIDISASQQQRALIAILREQNIAELAVSAALPYGWATVLEKAGITLSIHDFAREQRHKTEQQLGFMDKAQRVTEGAYDLVRKILSESTIEGSKILHGGKPLTSEWVKSQVQLYFIERNFSNPHGMIVASGEQAARPHDDGHGELLANSTIIVDIFPMDNVTGYYADMTRTYVKGTPSADALAIHTAVQEVQKTVLDQIQVGSVCGDIYALTVEEFKKRGFESGSEKGFMHRTGHGLGLSVHEDPSLLKGWKDKMEPGMVTTVEPGLYYPGIGGSRIEDVVVFHEDGRKENITRYPSDLIIP